MFKITSISFFLVILLALGIGLSSGLAVYTFYYADGLSYLKDDPKACMNCHVMKANFDSWNQSTHRAVATCNNCHAPHDFVGKYLSKAINGFNHSWAFTFGTYKDTIRIKQWNKRITNKACLGCHSNLLNHNIIKDKESSCIKCHKGVGHSF